MAFALAIRKTSDQARRTILSTTLIIVIVTVILCGGLTTQLLQWLRIRSADHYFRLISRPSSISNAALTSGVS